MPTRLLLTALVLGALALPASAAADGYVPGEVIVHYEDGTTASVAAAAQGDTGTVVEQALPGGSEQLAIEDGESVRETIAELEDDPNVSYAVPNWRAHAAALPATDPGARRQWNLFSALGNQRRRGVDARRAARRPGRSRGDGRRARQRRGLREPRALPARARPAPLDLRQAVRLHRQRPAPE